MASESVTTRRVRCLLGGSAAAGAAVVWELAAIERASGLIRATTAAVTLATLVVLALAFAPQRSLERLANAARARIGALRTCRANENPRPGILLATLGVALYVAIVGVLLFRPDDPADDDQGAFLETAAEVHAAGGPVRLVSDLYRGRFAEANRHPLYIGLLSWRPTAAFGRGLSVATGAITLFVLSYWVSRTRGISTAGLFCLLLGVNMAFGQFSTRVVCDVLMVLWGGIAFLLASRTAEKPSLMGDAALGGVLGLAYLTKGTGQLLLVGAILWKAAIWFVQRSTLGSAVADGQTGAVARPTGAIYLTAGTMRGVVLPVLLVFAGWAAVSSPLLVRNVRMYGSATYNVNNWLLFVDQFEHPVPLSQRQSLGAAARAYWESHTIVQIVQRETSGLVWEWFMLLRMLGPFPLDDSRVLFGVPLAACAVISILGRPRSEHLLLGIWTLLLVGLFAWYVPIAAGERFLLPLLAPIQACAAEGLVMLAGLISQSRREL